MTVTLRLPQTLISFCLMLLIPLVLIGCINNSTSNPDVLHVGDVPDSVPPEDEEEIIEEEGDSDQNNLSFGIKSLSAGENHNCAIKNLDATLWCWGENKSTELGTGGTKNSSSATQTSKDRWRSISAGTDHSCAIDNNQQIWCWGSDKSRQIGSPPPANQQTPLILLDEDSTWLSVSAGHNHTCAIKSDQSLWCWGSNNQHQLGLEGIAVADRPFQIESQTDWLTISAGKQFSCGLRAISEDDQRLYCWGQNSSGQAGTTPVINEDINTPLQIGVATHWQNVDTGGSHACAVNSDNGLYCWGDNTYGQLGQGSNISQQATPTQIATTIQWQTVTSGEYHSCAIQTDGALWCWGNNETGQLGLGHTQHQSQPALIEHTKTWLSVTAGAKHTCALDEDYRMHCWGLNIQGQLGNGAVLYINNLDQVRQYESSDNWHSIAAARQHTCGLKQDFSDASIKTLWCGGLNHFGQLGIHSTSHSDSPKQIRGTDQTLTNWISFSLGQYSTCAIDINQQLYCWGSNSHGQLAHATATNSINNWGPNNPITLRNNDWFKVSAGALHTCALKNIDELWCWGDNSKGQIGQGTAATPTTYPDPQQIPGEWRDVAVGGYIDPIGDNDILPHLEGGHTCAIKTNNTLWCWGENNYTQLGDGGTILRSFPQQVGSDNDNEWKKIVSGNSHSCALKNDQTIWCWGRFDLGATGIGSEAIAGPGAVSSVGKIWITLEAGENYSCAIDTANQLWCWGAATDGQLSNSVDLKTSSDGNVFSPGKVGFDTDWQALALGQSHSCALREDNVGNRNLYCWGKAPQIQLGNGSSWEESPIKLSLQ